MIIYRARVFDTPESPFTGGELRAESDVALVVDDGLITDRTDFASATAAHPEAEVVDLRAGVLIPGLVDTHVHYPQVRAIGHLGKPLLEWLDHSALPEEAKLAEETYARAVAGEFLTGLTSAGTTSAMVFGSHFATAMDVLFSRAAEVGLRVTSGLVTSDVNLPEALLTNVERSHAEGQALIDRWHGVGRLRYAVTPRFSFSAGPELLAAGGQLVAENPGIWVTSHLNENRDEIAGVAELHPESQDYLDTYDRAGLLGRRTILAHNVHPGGRELARMAEAGAAAAHCPTSNSALASGFFPLRRHIEAGVRVALGSDVGAGTGFSLLKEGAQAYFMQQLDPAGGVPLSGAHLLHLATAAGAEALELDEVGDLSVGKRFDAAYLRPTEGQPLDVGLTHAASDEDALAKIFALGTPADITQVWIDGALVKA
ncbi:MULTISPECIES: guanine deaminase [unclassified Brevibacterium]|uniref:guanine deaminase n=1 Tax=unclassified Brevibacterium TaxID=2614124 RepID=UPI001E61D86A|nr:MULTISPECIES: guanine deaminase [unclassified Brevibacterium]MCD1287351.1 guanine deaminase [Brevibacterium sp. CCUG 69071]MDK8436856.1 guanine deaminase [Brevibacterium sp. H-BE7]